MFLTIWFIGSLFTLGFETAQNKRKNESMLYTDVLAIIVSWPAVLGGILEFYLNED